MSARSRVVVAGDAPVIVAYLPALRPPSNPAGPSPAPKPGQNGDAATNTAPAPATTDVRRQPALGHNDLVGSGTGAVASGAPFPAPARQTVHALLAHTAYRHRSPIGVRSHPVYISGETEYLETAEPVAVMAFAPPAARDISFAIVEYC